MQCLVGSLWECGRERGLDQRQADQLDQRRPFPLPLLLHGHGQRVVQAKVDKLCKRRLFGKLQSLQKSDLVFEHFVFLT